ncbi:hypothetical protein GCWU000246_00396 [Jonquetella anthropi E3_33 E1]|nr:hypothetical protein GCWU000246_00396 [Jonquetella anthropi E3_33 E1]
MLAPVSLETKAPRLALSFKPQKVWGTAVQGGALACAARERKSCGLSCPLSFGRSGGCLSYRTPVLVLLPEAQDGKGALLLSFWGNLMTRPFAEARARSVPLET